MKYEYDNEYPFAVYLTNLGKYNEGKLIGEWVKFPTTAEEIAKVLRNIGIRETDEFGCPYEEWFITDYDCYIPGLYKMAGEYESLDALNMLAVKLEEMSEPEYQKFSAVVSAGDGMTTVQDLINLAENLDYYMVYPGIENEADLGRYYLEESGIYDLTALGSLADYIDAERFGRDISIEEGGTFTDYGYVVSDTSPLPVHYDGMNVPKEFQVMSEAENYLKNAEMTLEDDFNMIDGILNNGPKAGNSREEGEKDVMNPKREEKISVKEALAKICEGCGQKETCKDISKNKRVISEPVL